MFCIMCCEDCSTLQLPELEREVELSPTQKESTIEGGTGAGGAYIPAKS